MNLTTYQSGFNNSLKGNGQRMINFLLHLTKYSVSKTYRELNRINKLKRYTSGETNLLGPQLTFADSASFTASYSEIFKRGIYNFNSKRANPVIIDCGANIGLSLIYFKNLYPKSSIIAFEPDPHIFKVLSDNIKSFGLTDITLYNSCIWNEDTTLTFAAEGADGGRISSLAGNEVCGIEVKAKRLRNFLKEKVDLLKIDIEGAETIVLKDCADLLGNVDYLFVEYHSFANQKQNLHELLAILNEAGFRVFASGQNYSPQPFINIGSILGMDLQLNIFAYRK